MNLLKRFNSTSAPGAVVLIRVMVGLVFLSEGIQKFLFSQADGAGRFAKIGIPRPELMAPFVGIVEIGCGLLLLFGLFTRLATLPLLIDICVAIISTKIPILLGHGIGTSVFPNWRTTDSGAWHTKRAPIARCCSAWCFCSAWEPGDGPAMPPG